MLHEWDPEKAAASDDDLRPEYDLASLEPGVRGKYLERAREGNNQVLIDPDLMKRFPTGEAVNRALRMHAEVAENAVVKPGPQARVPNQAALEDAEIDRLVEAEADVDSAWDPAIRVLAPAAEAPVVDLPARGDGLLEIRSPQEVLRYEE